MARKRPKTFDFDRFRRYVLESVQEVGRHFTKPDDDWIPLLIAASGKKVTIVNLVDLFRDKGSKAMGGEALALVFLKLRPHLAALINSAWSVRIAKDDPMAETTMEMCKTFGASSHPNRKEIVMALIADSVRHEGWEASIERLPDKPPVLGAFDKANAIDGRMVEWIRQAFQYVGGVT